MCMVVCLSVPVCVCFICQMGHTEPSLHEAAKSILLPMGEFFQIQVRNVFGSSIHLKTENIFTEECEFLRL